MFICLSSHSSQTVKFMYNVWQTPLYMCTCVIIAHWCTRRFCNHNRQQTPDPTFSTNWRMPRKHLSTLIQIRHSLGPYSSQIDRAEPRYAGGGQGERQPTQHVSTQQIFLSLPLSLSFSFSLYIYAYIYIYYILYILLWSFGEMLPKGCSCLSGSEWPEGPGDGVGIARWESSRHWFIVTQVINVGMPPQTLGVARKTNGTDLITDSTVVSTWAFGLNIHKRSSYWENHMLQST